jgi:DNA-binding MarR family transcriptional regulator
MPDRRTTSGVPVAKRTQLLTDYVTFQLDVLSGLGKAHASVDYEAACGVTVRGLRVLRYAAIEPGLLQGRMASLCFLDKTLVSKMVSSLVRRGLLRREIGAEDARNITLWLTAEGERVVEVCDPIGTRLERQMMAVLTAEERQLFKRCVEKVTAGLIAEDKRRSAEQEQKVKARRSSDRDAGRGQRVAR